jgi:tyrosine-protein phosphatase SIW14
MKSYFRAFAATFVFVLSFMSIAVTAQTSPENFPNIKIKNFGQMDERYYRGAQPEPGDYQALKDLGVNTVVDLRNDPTDYEKKEVEALGMKYINIPMSGWKYPKNESIEAFLKVVSDPANVVFAHCKAGKHRTGITGAVYRFTKFGWDYDRAYQEMKNYNFTPLWVHWRLKEFVGDYAEKMEKEKAKQTSTRSAAQPASN